MAALGAIFTVFVVLVLAFGWTWGLIGFIGAMAHEMQPYLRARVRRTARIIRFKDRVGSSRNVDRRTSGTLAFGPKGRLESSPTQDSRKHCGI